MSALIKHLIIFQQMLPDHLVKCYSRTKDLITCDQAANEDHAHYQDEGYEDDELELFLGHLIIPSTSLHNHKDDGSLELARTKLMNTPRTTTAVI